MKQLSILIPVHSSHLKFLDDLITHLRGQVAALGKEKEVEVLYLVDNGELSTGTKRNHLLSEAKGKYVVFVDADDWVADYYIEDMLKALQSDPDCVAINGTYTKDGKNETKWFLSKDNPNKTVTLNGEATFLRTTNHITATKRELALLCGGFPDKSNGEDSAYSAALNPFLKSEVVISRPMYFYRYISHNKLYK